MTIPQMRRKRIFKLSSRRAASHSQIRAKKLTRVKSQLASHKLSQKTQKMENQRRRIEKERDNGHKNARIHSIFQVC